jgi:hypothetical protein
MRKTRRRGGGEGGEEQEEKGKDKSMLRYTPLS